MCRMQDDFEEVRSCLCTEEYVCVEKITKFSYELMARGNRVIAAGFFIL